MQELFPNGWAHYLAGGLLVGAGTAIVFLTTGIRAGASGFFSTTLGYLSNRQCFQTEALVRERSWRTVFSVGLLLGAALYTAIAVGSPFVTEVPWWRLAAGGLLVGFGTRLCRGCTSGHGICGLSVGARSSLLAVATFMAVAIGAAHLMRWLGATP